MGQSILSDKLKMTLDGKPLDFEIVKDKDAHQVSLRSEVIEKTEKFRSIKLIIDQELAGTENLLQSFSIYPDKEFAVVSSSIQDDQSGQAMRVDILFSEPLDQSADYSGFVSVEPEIELKVESRDRQLRLRGAFERGIDYQVVLKPGIVNNSGEKTLRTVRKQFTFPHLNPQMKFDQSGGILPFSGNGVFLSVR